MTDDTGQSQTEEFDQDNLLQQFSEEFDTLCQLRHGVGEEEYGHATFLTAPLVRMAAEELADLCNYARYMYVKLRYLEEYLNARGIDLSASAPEEIRDGNAVPFGPASFIPAEKVQGFLSRKEQGR